MYIRPFAHFVGYFRSRIWIKYFVIYHKEIILKKILRHRQLWEVTNQTVFSSPHRELLGEAVGEGARGENDMDRDRDAALPDSAVAYIARSKRDVAEHFGVAWSTMQPRLAGKIGVKVGWLVPYKRAAFFCSGKETSALGEEQPWPGSFKVWLFIPLADHLMAFRRG